MSEIEQDPYIAGLDLSQPTDAMLHGLQVNASQLLDERGFCSLEERKHTCLTETASLLFKVGFPPEENSSLKFKPTAEFQLLDLSPDNRGLRRPMYITFLGTDVSGFSSGTGDAEQMVAVIDDAIKDPGSGYAGLQVLGFVRDLMSHLARDDVVAANQLIAAPERDGYAVADLVRMATYDEGAELRRKYTYMARIGLVESLTIARFGRVDSQIDYQDWLAVATQDYSKGRQSSYQVYATGQRDFREFKIIQHRAIEQMGLIQVDRVREKLADMLATERLGSSEID